MSTVLKDQADFATSAGHWYCAKTGEARYTLIGANGKERATTVRDARKLGLVPSVTTILKQAAAPRLVNWMKEQVAKAAYSERPREGESEADYLARILPLAEEVARKARDKGTEIHGAIENLDRHGPYADHVGAFFDAVNSWCGVTEWDHERSFASPLGFGGKLDLSCPGFVLDAKTTDKDLADLKTWPDHRRQLAAYRHGLGMPEARCAIVYVSSVKPEARLIEIGEEELQQGWNEFRSLLAFYYHANKMELPCAPTSSDHHP